MGLGGLAAEPKKRSVSTRRTRNNAVFSTPINHPETSPPKETIVIENRQSRQRKRNTSITPPETLNWSVKRQDTNTAKTIQPEQAEMIDESLAEIRGILGDSRENNPDLGSLSNSLLDDDDRDFGDLLGGVLELKKKGIHNNN